MRSVIALLALAALCGCRSTLAPEIRPGGDVVAQRHASSPPPGVPELRGLRVHVEGDSTIIEANFSPASDPELTPWDVRGFVHADGLAWNSGGWWPYVSIQEPIDGRFVGSVTAWRDKHHVRLALTLSDPQYSLTGEINLLVVANGYEQGYSVTVRAPHGGTQLAGLE